MRVLFLCHSFNSLAQRLHAELRERGHAVSVELDVCDAVTEEAVALHRPDVVIAPFLKRAIPESVWRRHRCLVVHPGVAGDRGPSALDWAILRGEREWGATVLEANAELDAGDVWATRRFAMRGATKGSLYRHEVAEAAVAGVLEALAGIASGARPRPLDYSAPETTGRPHAPIRRQDRAIDWTRQGSEEILRRVRSADGAPGAFGEWLGEEYRYFDAEAEEALRGEPGSILARRGGAVCVGTADGALWIGHLRRERADDGLPPLKLPAAAVVGASALAGVPELAGPPRDVAYEERDGVGYLAFPFYNGAMGVDHCARLRLAVRRAKSRPIRALVLLGGPDFWSNGMHLGLIEDADSPAAESWRNIQAMDDLVLEILDTPGRLVVSALRGNAGAGGVFLALAADRVWARSGVVLNPHYKGMGDLYGSEYWTYLLPRRAGPRTAAEIASSRLPMVAAQARRGGLIDDAFGDGPAAFLAEVRERATALARDPALPALLEEKARRRRDDEAIKPLERYRAEELERMRLNFFGFDPSYHVARYNFIRRVPKSRTPSYLAAHRGAAR